MIPSDAQWLGGPDFHLILTFSLRVLNPAEADKASQLLQTMAIEGPWADTDELGVPSASRDDWVSLPVSYGLWHVSDAVVGVRILPDIVSGRELWLCIPPRQVENYFGPYPWDLEPGWVTEPIIRLHRVLIEKCHALCSAYDLKAALLEDESWTSWRPDEANGIIVHPDLAAAAGLRGERQGHMFAVPF